MGTSTAESSNVTVWTSLLSICYNAPAMFFVLSVVYAEQIHALWLYKSVECWHWTTRMKSGADLQPTSSYGGALPAILAGLHEAWACCQKFPVTALAGRCLADFQDRNKILVYCPNFIWKRGRAHRLGSCCSWPAPLLPPFSVHVLWAAKSAPGLAICSPASTRCI